MAGLCQHTVPVSQGQQGGGLCRLWQRGKSDSQGISRGKSLREQAAPEKSCSLIYSNALWVMYKWEPIAGPVLKMSLKIHLFPEMMTGNKIPGAP